MRILVIEDDITLSDYMKAGFEEYGHVVDTAHDGKNGLFLITSESYDILILDRMVPELDGMTLLKTIRAMDNQTPVIILSAMGKVDDRVEGLRAGAEDYLTKPFAFAELHARVEGLAARKSHESIDERCLQVGDLTLDRLARSVHRAGQDITLHGREFRLLEYMLRHKGQVVTRTMLLEHVWDYHFDPQTNVIDVHISRLRAKIDRDFPEQLIRTVRGAGYMIPGDVG